MLWITIKQDHCMFSFYTFTFNARRAREQRNPSDKKTRLPQMNVETTYPAQWIETDVRNFDFSVIGKFNVVMINPSFDSSKALNYTRKLDIDSLVDKGLLFVWSPAKYLEVVREWITHWGFKIADEIVWVKLNQLQMVASTNTPSGEGLYSAKEHCIVAFKGTSDVRTLTLNRQIDCDVIVAEAHPNGQKPDEIYGVIERLSPGGRKLELYGSTSSLHDGWMTLGRELNKYNIIEREVF
jgi:mRNA (2'-O-methyladenosine-N6-)-methyltransferase